MHDYPENSQQHSRMDFYHPTMVALEAMYPKVVSGGDIIIDDYGAYPEGAGKATDEFLDKMGLRVLLNRIDGSARLWIKY